MGLITDRQLALELASLVLNAGDESLEVGGDKEVEALLKTKPEGLSRFLWLSNMDAPVWRFWQIRHAGFLTPDCHVVFTGIKDCPDWNDLARIYGGSRFGSLFIMKMSPSTKPGVCPSQRGMYFN
jgi:hypothetical protein